MIFLKNHLKRKGLKIDASSGSMIMAIGIFLIGAIQQFSFINTYLGTIMTYLLVILWLLLLITFLLSFVQHHYRRHLFEQPITFFGIGTWIASTSVIGNLVVQRFPTSLFVIKGLLVLNFFLWLLFIFYCTKQLKTIIVKGFILKTHGALLLSTVSTQSIAILMVNTKTIFAKSLIIDVFIFIGIFYYLFSICLIVKRFSKTCHSIHEWKNTDCIIHGAVSITGLSMTLTEHFSFFLIMIVWSSALCLFLLVESFELIRGYKRVRKYGFFQGLCQYHVSQWSRNFTFGMFYLFTMRLLEHYTATYHSLLLLRPFLTGLGWIVLLLLIIQISLFSYSLSQGTRRETIQNKDVSI